MNKIRIIDLFNMISKGEEVPKKIKYSNIIFEYNEDYKNYESINMFGDIFSYIDGTHINDEVEIIEEPKKIENIKLDSGECIEYYEDGIKKHLNTNKKDKMYVKILNEIIDILNSKEDEQ